LVIHILLPLAIQVSPLQLGAAGHRADHVGAGAGLAHRQRALPLAAAQLGQVLLALRGRAVVVEVLHAEVGMRAVGQADRAGGAGDFLHRHQMREVAHARAAVLARHGDAQQAHLAELAPQVLRKRVVVVDLRGARGDLGGGETAHGLAQASMSSPSSKARMGWLRWFCGPGPRAKGGEGGQGTDA
jgi:hypothetical protein